MTNFTKKDIGTPVVFFRQTTPDSDGLSTVSIYRAKVEDVSLDGTTLKVRLIREGTCGDILEIPATSAFYSGDMAYSSIVNAVKGTGNYLYWKEVSNGCTTAFRTYRMHLDPVRDKYGDLKILDIVLVKYGESIPQKYLIQFFKSEICEVVARCCHGARYADSWGRCISCDSDDVYYEYGDNDSVYHNGTYTEVFRCQQCGAVYREIYRVTKLARRYGEIDASDNELIGSTEMADGSDEIQQDIQKNGTV